MPSLPIGIVGAGRRRNGLGPYLARWCERHGLRVAGIGGRDRARTEEVAAGLAREFGHPVAVHASAAALAGSGVRALVVATPPEHHLEGLRAALGAGIACLCEKPLAPAGSAAAAEAAVAEFAARRLWLVENCQWPYALPALVALHPDSARALPRRLQMGLSPASTGPAMVEDSLSHLLSVAQALLPARAELRLRAASREDPRQDATADVVRLAFDWAHAGGGGVLDAELHLRWCASQPRPAWLAVDGRRMDRRIGPDYALAFAAGDRSVSWPDPMGLLVAAFAAALGGRDDAAREAEALRVRARLRLYRDVLGALAAAREP